MPRQKDQADTEAALRAGMERAAARTAAAEDVTSDERYQQLTAKQEAERTVLSALVDRLPDTLTVSTLNDDLVPIEVDARTAVTSVLDTCHRQQRRALRQEILDGRKRPSAEQEALERRSRPNPAARRSKSLERFGYWRIPDINPAAIADPPDAIEDPHGAAFAGQEAHAYLEELYGSAFRDGDRDAVFHFAQEDAWCLRSAWVVEQLEIWRDDGPRGRDQIKHFADMFCRNRTTTGLSELFETIVHDQQILRRLLFHLDDGKTITHAAVLVQDECSTSIENVRAVERNYRPYVETCKRDGLTSEALLSRLAAMVALISPL